MLPFQTKQNVTTGILSSLKAILGVIIMSSCTNQCPPCEPSEPTGCTVPAGVATGVKIYVVDSEGCVKSLTNPTQSAILHYNAEDGTVEWKDGSEANPLCLPVLQSFNPESGNEWYAEPINNLIIVDDNGCFKSLNLAEADNPNLIAFLTPDGIKFKALAGNIYPDAPGLVYVDGSNEAQVITPGSAGQVLQDNGDGTYSWVTLPTPEQIAVGYKNLVCSNMIAGSPSAASIALTADAVTLSTSGGVKKSFSSVNVTASISGSGAGGLDTGIEAISTWYYIYLISDGTNVYAMFSANAITPTLPAGFTFFLKVGSVRNNGAGSFVNFYQVDEFAYVSGNSAAATAINGTPNIDADLSAFVPPLTTEARISLLLNNSEENSGFNASIYQSTAVNFLVMDAVIAGDGGATGGAQERLISNVPIINNQTLRIETNIAAVSQTCSLTITGYRNN